MIFDFEKPKLKGLEKQDRLYAAIEKKRVPFARTISVAFFMFIVLNIFAALSPITIFIQFAFYYLLIFWFFKNIEQEYVNKFGSKIWKNFQLYLLVFLPLVFVVGSTILGIAFGLLFSLLIENIIIAFALNIVAVIFIEFYCRFVTTPAARKLGLLD